MTPMKISIAMATYNGAKYIRKQLESFMHQTRLPDELVVTDDVSSDETVAIVEDFARSAPFEVRLYRNERNLGYSKNFEAAITKCTSDLIFLSDQDDYWFPEKIETIARIFEERPDTWVTISDTEITDANLHRTGRTKFGQIRRLGLDSNCFVTGCCTAFRRAMVPLLCPLPGVGFVYDTWLNTLSHVLGIRQVVPQVLQYYRRHGDNTSQWVGSSIRPVGKMDLIRAYGPQNSRTACHRRLERLAVLESRLKGCRPFLANIMGLGKQVDIALDKITAERTSTEKRLELLSRGRLLRLLPGLSLYLKGGYRHFSGWKSFAKDLLIP